MSQKQQSQTARPVPLKPGAPPAQPLVPRTLLSHLPPSARSPPPIPTPLPLGPPAAHTVRPLFRAVGANKRGG